MCTRAGRQSRATIGPGDFVDQPVIGAAIRCGRWDRTATARKYACVRQRIDGRGSGKFVYVAGPQVGSYADQP